MKDTLQFPFTRRRFLQGTGAALAAVSFGGSRAFAADKKINVYNWDTYIGDTTLGSFTDKTGIEVQYDLYANLEEMFAKFQAGNPGYDIIFPSDYMVGQMIALGALFCLIAIVSDGTWAVLAARARSWLAHDPRHLAWTSVAGGLVMIALGLLLLLG